MSITKVSAFEGTIHKTNVWLKDVMAELGWEDHQRAYHALRAVLHALRDRLTVEEATDLGAQLPMLIRGFYYEGWNPSRTPVAEHKREEFLRHVADEFRGDLAANPEQITRVVFKVVAKHVTAGEIEDVKRILPEPIRALWT